MSEPILPYLRDQAWSGWGQLAWTEPPGFEPSGWVPRLGFMAGAPGARRLLAPAEVSAMGTSPEALAPIAIQNLAMVPSLWQPLHKAGGVLGIGARLAVIEARDELAVERMLLAMFVDGAQRMLQQPSAILYAPMRGILRASLAAGDPGVEQAIHKEKGDAVMAYDATAAAGGEAVAAASFQTAVGRPIETIAPLGAGRDRPYVPKIDRVTPKLEAPDARLWWDATPFRTLGADDNPLAPRLTLGVRGPSRFHHLLQGSYAALRTDFRSLERAVIAAFERGPLAVQQLDDGAVRLGGFTGVGAAEQLLVGEAMMELHRRLGSHVLRVAIPSEGVLGAVPAGAGVPDGDLLYRTAAVTGGWITLSGAIHVVENGVIQQSVAPR
jgi:hypothetical protein